MFANRNGYLTSSWVTSYYPNESVVTTKPDLAVLANELKVPLNKYDDTQDTYLEGLLAGVQAKIERFIGKDATPRTRRSFWRYPKGTIGFSYNPVGAILEVKAYERDGSFVILTENDYAVHGIEQKSITFHKSYYAVEITHESGYEDTPDPIRQAIIQECMFQFKNRNDPSLPTRVSVGNICLEARHLLMEYYSYAR